MSNFITKRSFFDSFQKNVLFNNMLDQKYFQIPLNIL